MIPSWLATHGAAALAAAVIVAAPMQWRQEAAVSRLERNHAQAIATMQADAMERQQAAQVAMEALQSQWAHAESQAYRSLRDAESEIDLLRAAVDTGRQRLRVAATCPADGLPAAGTPAGVDHGARPELDAAARSAYFALRAGIERVTAQLEACQARLQ